MFPPLYVLTEDTDGTGRTITLGTTAGIAKGAFFQIVDKNGESQEIQIEEVNAASTETVQAESYTGQVVRGTATSVLTDVNAQFITNGVVPGDILRISSFRFEVLSVASETEITVLGQPFSGTNTYRILRTVYSVTATKDVHAFAVDDFAAMRPSRRPVEGLSGFYPITDPSSTGAHTSGDRTFTDANTNFHDAGVVRGDTLRIILSDGAIETYTVDVLNSNEISLEIHPDEEFDTTRSNVYYQIIKEYDPEKYSTYDLEQAALPLSRVQLRAVSQFLRRQQPSWIFVSQIPVVIEASRTVGAALEGIFLREEIFSERITGQITLNARWGTTTPLGTGFRFASAVDSVIQEPIVRDYVDPSDPLTPPHSWTPIPGFPRN